MSTSKFRAGDLSITQKAKQVMARNHVQADALLARHLRGDWGDLTEMAKRNNDAVLSRGGALRSGYLLPDGKSIWIVTSAERNSTIIMLPEDY